jgi:uncharacterized repeat protein (TIGR01451 family)
MKKAITLILFVFIFVQVKAQYVNIPDTGFVSFLTAKYPTAMSGSMMDTTNTYIVNEDSLICNYRSIYNLYGVQFFDNLKFLDCYLDKLTTLPDLPTTLEVLQCGGNSLTSLPTLPTSLKLLDCSGNNLPSLPSLPGSISVLFCQGNSLSSLPTLPSALTTIICSMNNLISLPSLPSSITDLYCDNNLLTSLPSLPSSLLLLHCDGNKLTSLPALPGSLKYLYCYRNNLTSIPTLPSSLKSLLCENNNLVSLPSLPSSLTTLPCKNNFIATLPTLPSLLEYLDCSNNRLTSIPNIPNKLYDFNCQDNSYLACLPAFSIDSFNRFQVKKGTSISCLPKMLIINYSYDGSNLLPVCSPGAGCAVQYNIIGNVHQDTSATCLLDSLYNGNTSPRIKLIKYKNGILNQQTYTNAIGQYSFDADISDSIDIFIDTATQPFILSCPLIGRISARVTASDSMFYYQNFGIKCKGGGIDLGVNSIYGTFRKGFTRPLYVNAGELISKYKLSCAKGISGTVTTTISGSVSYDAPQLGALIPTTVSGGTITYSIADFGTIDFNKAFNIFIKVDSAAVLGSSICIHTVVSTSAVDINHINDTLTYCGNVVNSSDPNEKLVYPAETIGPDEWLTYTINFQNTGTDTAYNIIVRDTLDNYLDIGSFTYLASSHNPQVDVKGNAVAFKFPYINLLDSVHNEVASHGWVQYKIKTLSSLPTFANVSNKASIYFDDNDLIVTNTTSNINKPLSINYSPRNANFKLYPNPASSIISIEATEEGEFIMFDLMGAIVYQNTVSKPNSAMNITLPKLANGLYIYHFISDKGARNTGKIYLHSK